MPTVPRWYLINCGSQAVARGSCLSQVLDRGALAVARAAILCASHVRDRGALTGAQTETWSQELNRGAQADAHGTVPCASQRY
jgi:hypothetical protein